MNDEDDDEGSFLSGFMDVGAVAVCGLGVVFCAIDGAWLFAAILGAVGVGYGLFALSTRKVMRDADELFDDAGEARTAPTEATLAIDALDDAIRTASSVPFTDQVRLDRREVDHLLARLRTALPRGSSTLSTPFDELDALLRNAKSIPLTNEIRLDRDQVYDVIDRMRASFAEER
jgi:hypothetical protein